jgi:hypothetical protein
MKLLLTILLIFVVYQNNLFAKELNKNIEILEKIYELNGSHDYYNLKDNGLIEIKFQGNQINLKFHFPSSETLEIEDIFFPNGKRMIIVNGESLISTDGVEGPTSATANPNSAADGPDGYTNPTFSLAKFLSPDSITYLEGIPRELAEAIHAKGLSAPGPGRGPDRQFGGIQQKSMDPNSGMNEDSGRLMNCVGCALGLLSYASEIAAIATAPANLGFGAAAALILHPATVASIAFNCPKAVQAGRK